MEGGRRALVGGKEKERGRKRDERGGGEGGWDDLTKDPFHCSLQGEDTQCSE